MEKTNKPNNNKITSGIYKHSSLIALTFNKKTQTNKMDFKTGTIFLLVPISYIL